LWTEKDIDLDGLEDRLIQRVEICSPEPKKIMIDGDILEGLTEISLTPGPDLRVVNNLYAAKPDQ
jgi:hypothetical protein